MTRFIIGKELFFLPYFSGFCCFSEFFRLKGLSLDMIYYLFDAALDFHVQKKWYSQLADPLPLHHPLPSYWMNELTNAWGRF